MAAVFFTAEFAGKQTEQQKVKRDCDREGTATTGTPERRKRHSGYDRGNGQKLSEEDFLWREEEGQTAGVGGRGITQDDREGHRGLCLLRILSPS